MTITITPQGPSPVAIGWGVWVSLQTSLIGPFPSGTRWVLNISTDTDGLNTISTDNLFSNANPVSFPVGIDAPGQSITHFKGNFAATDGQTVTVGSELIVPGSGIVDSSAQTMPWEHTSRDLPAQIASLPTSGQGLTATQSAQLARADEATQVVVRQSDGNHTVPLSQLLSPITLDALTLNEITSGPQSGFVAASLPNSTVGIIVRITTIGALYAATAADDGWYVPELAVVNFFRGSDLVGRVGMHTVSRFIYPLPGAWAEWVTAFLGGVLPPDYSIQVTFANGNSGRVYRTNNP